MFLFLLNKNVYAVQLVVSAITFLLFLVLNSSIYASECEKIWVIENLKINEINENPTLAKQNAEKKVSRLAFEKLLRRISLNSPIIIDGFINEISINEINSLIDYRLIKEEKTLLNRYIGTFNFCFQKNKVTELLSKNKIAWSELYSRPIIVFPVWKTEFVLRLWKDPNPIKKILNDKIENFDGLINLIFPENKIGVLRSIDAQLALNGDERSIARAIERSGSSRALNIIFEIEKLRSYENINLELLKLSEDEKHKIMRIKVKANIHNNKGVKQGLLYERNININIDFQEKEIKKIIDEIIFLLEESWKKANIFIGKNLSEVEIFISVNQLKYWVKAISKLKSLPGVKSVSTKKLDKNGAIVILLVEGGVDRFVSIVLENKIPFTGTKENLILDAQKL